MTHPGTKDLITPEDAAKLGARDPKVALILAVAETFHVPSSVFGSNVRSAHNDRDVVFVCDGVVMAEPLVGGKAMVLIEALAPLLGFYNAEPGVLCAAYGKPVLHRAWNVVVGSTIRPIVSSANTIYYEAVVFHVQSEHIQK